METNEPLPVEQGNATHWRSAALRYAAAIGLMSVVYLLASLNPAETGTRTLNISPYFAVFWLIGGSLTLGLLARAARKNKAGGQNTEHLH